MLTNASTSFTETLQNPERPSADGNRHSLPTRIKKNQATSPGARFARPGKIETGRDEGTHRAVSS